jgi:hypothetical protein
VAGNLGPLYEEKKVIDSPYYLKKFTPHNGGFHLSKFCIISQEQSSADYGEGDPSMGHSRTQFCFVLFSFVVLLDWGTLWHLQGFLQCIKYIILEFTPLHHSPSFPLP